MKRIVFVKDEDGLYDKDPKHHRDAKRIPKLELAEVLERNFSESILDRQLFSAWKKARHIQEIQIVNGLVPGQLTKALAGEPVGTVITK